MNKLTITILFLMNLCFSHHIDSVATKPYGTDWKNSITEEEIEEVFGMPDTMDIDEDMGNVRYIYTRKRTCHFRMDNGVFTLYAIEVIDGNVNGIKIGMSKKEVLKQMGKPNENICTKKRLIMEWNFGNHIIMAKFKIKKFCFFKKRKLQELVIAKVIH